MKFIFNSKSTHPTIKNDIFDAKYHFSNLNFNRFDDTDYEVTIYDDYFNILFSSNNSQEVNDKIMELFHSSNVEYFKIVAFGIDSSSSYNDLKKTTGQSREYTFDSLIEWIISSEKYNHPLVHIHHNSEFKLDYVIQRFYDGKIAKEWSYDQFKTSYANYFKSDKDMVAVMIQNITNNETLSSDDKIQQISFLLK